jgi:hypothetical protein
MPMVLKVKHHEATVATASVWAETNEVSNKAGKAYLILRRSARPQRREDAPEESGPSSQQLQIQRSKDPSASKILFDGQFVEEESDDDVRLNSPSVHSQEEASIASALSRYDTVHDGTDSDVQMDQTTEVNTEVVETKSCGRSRSKSPGHNRSNSPARGRSKSPARRRSKSPSKEKKVSPIRVGSS